MTGLSAMHSVGFRVVCGGYTYIDCVENGGATIDDDDDDDDKGNHNNNNDP
jgi:hypothetical protein